MKKKGANSMVADKQTGCSTRRDAENDNVLFSSMDTAMLAALDSYLWKNDRDEFLGNLEMLSGALSLVKPERLRPLLRLSSTFVNTCLHMVRIWNCGSGLRVENGMFSPPPSVPFIAFLLAPTGFQFTEEEMDSVRDESGYGVEDVRKWHEKVMSRLEKRRGATPRVCEPGNGAERKGEAS